jgi:site-specific recombinase XerD
MTLAVVRNLGSPSRLRSALEVEDYEQELVDQYALSMAAAGLTDGHIVASRAAVFELVRFVARPLWTVVAGDVDRHLVDLRRGGLGKGSVYTKVGMLARFFDFLVARYQGDIHELTGFLVEQPVDEYNRPASPAYGEVRVPPSDDDVEKLFTQWGAALVHSRKYLPAARDYFAASLWRRLGLRINETLMLDIRDWRPDLGEHGKLHVRHGKGSGGRGPKSRVIPAINSANALITWWLTDVRHQFGPDWSDPDAPMLPSERRDGDTGRCTRVGDDALRKGLAAAISRWLPAWNGRVTPHVLRHYCASSLYTSGVDLKAVQELLGHEWLSTTTRYIHVRSDHIDRAWTLANQRTAERFAEAGR